MPGSSKLRRFAAGFAVIGTVAGATACDPPPEPSEHVEVTYLDVPEPGINLDLPVVLSNGAGQVVVGGHPGTPVPGGLPIGRDPVAYFVDNGETTRLGEGSTLATDISEEGHVVGSGQLTEDGPSEPFLWHEGEWMTLPLEGAEYGRADSVNRQGTVAGAVGGESLGGALPAVWRDGQLITASLDLTLRE